jgi:hypothetical protein
MIVQHMTDATPTRHATTHHADKPRIENAWMNRLREAQSAGLDSLLLFAAELRAMQVAKAQAEWTEYRLWMHSDTGEFLGVITPEGTYRRVTRCYGWPCWACSSSPFWSTISATNSSLMRYARECPERTAEIEKCLVNPKHAYIAKALIKRHNRQSAALMTAIGGQS